MPYIIKEVDNGYKVCKKDEADKCFSKKPLTNNNANKQLKAIEINEHLEGSGNLDYVIAIPTYNRTDKLQEKTLKLLNEYNIKNKIYIIVNDKEQYDLYLKDIPKELYTDIIISNTKGIKEARNFIASYFKKDTKVVCLDDDLQKFVVKGRKKLQKLEDLNGFFKEAFNKCIDENTKLWGIYPVPNQLFMKNTISTGLKFIIGLCYGFISTPDDKSLITELVKQKEDYERSIKYFIKFGKIIRFNYISVNTTYYAKGGISSWMKDRKKDMETSAKLLLKHYPEYVNSIFYRKDGTAEIKLKKIDNSIEGLGKKIDIDFTKLDDTSVFYEKIENTEKYLKLKEELFNKLEETKIPKIEGPRSDKRKTRGDLLGFNAWTFTFGCGGRRNLGVGEFSPNSRYPELFDLLVKYGNEIVPKGYKYQVITVNKDMKAKKHTDGGNAGFSVITGLGDFSGGELNVYDKNGKNPVDYDLKDHTLIFNGSLLPHMTKPFKGRRYTIIYYAQKKPCQVKGKKMIGNGIPKDKELYEKIKKDIYEKNPKHSLFRSAQIVKEYKKQGGEFEEGQLPEMNIEKWFQQKWISANDYYHNKEKIPCGNSNTQEKFGEYPLCRPLKILESLKDEDIKKMIDKKNDLKDKHLITEKILDTDKYNIKSTITGMGNSIIKSNIPVSQIFLDFGEHKQLEDFQAFKKSNEMYKNLTTNYKLYDDKKANKLIKKYPEFEQMYNSVKYPVMKVDILRFIILYDRGGFYSDMDVIPFTKDLEKEKEDELTIWRPKNVLNYEVMYSPKGNEYLLDFLRFVKKTIEEKDRINIYKTWKLRYVLNTTGPNSFRNFLEKNPNKNIIFKEMNRITSDSDINYSIKNKEKFPFFTLGTVSWMPKDYTNSKIKTKRDDLRKEILKGYGKDKFIKQLEDINYPVEQYLKDAKEVAKKRGYNPDKLFFANNNDNKLLYESPEGKKYFGKAEYGDYLIWTFKENNKIVEKGYANKKRNVFRKSHNEITKKYKLNKFSPNELAINILW
jgi:hypothetical protein